MPIKTVWLKTIDEVFDYLLPHTKDCSDFNFQRDAALSHIRELRDREIALHVAAFKEQVLDLFRFDDAVFGRILLHTENCCLENAKLKDSRDFCAVCSLVALPADTSALRAFEQRVRLEELTMLNKHLEHNEWADIGSNCCERYITERIAALSQPSEGKESE